MSIADIPLEEFTKADKMDGGPPWNEEVLASRSEEWERRVEVGEDWDAVRAKLSSEKM